MSMEDYYRQSQLQNMQSQLLQNQFSQQQLQNYQNTLSDWPSIFQVSSAQVVPAFLVEKIPVNCKGPFCTKKIAPFCDDFDCKYWLEKFPNWREWALERKQAWRRITSAPMIPKMTS